MSKATSHVNPAVKATKAVSTSSKQTDASHPKNGFEVSGTSPTIGTPSNVTITAESKKPTVVKIDPEKVKAIKRKAEETQKQHEETRIAQQSPTQRNAEEAQGYCDALTTHISNAKGRYLRDENGEFSVLLDTRIPINFDVKNHAFNRLLLKTCNITPGDFLTKSTIVRLIDAAHASADKLKLRKFSAVSQDDTRLYVPWKDERQLVCITADQITREPNGDNVDHLWLEHPKLNPEIEPFNYAVADPTVLADFERLIVDNQACAVREMAWFVAVQEVLFPFVRELFQDRVIVVHEGPPGSGKTTGLDLICLLHGLVVTGDTTPAVLTRIGDCGLLAMDNKEQVNMTNGFTDFVLYLATGAERYRCVGEGYKGSNRHRPVGVITSIEGAYKSEAISRIVEVSYNAHERDRANFDKRRIRAEIKQKRHAILSALMPVLQRFLQIDREGRTIAVPDSLARFGENFKATVGLLLAYADVAAKPTGWADSIVKVWSETIQTREVDGDELTYMIEKWLADVQKTADRGTNLLAAATDSYLEECVKSCTEASYKGQTGELTTTTCDQLLGYLRSKDQFNKAIPKTPAALGRRLRSMPSRLFQVLDDTSGLPQLKKTKSARLIGFFEPKADAEAKKTAVTAAPKITPVAPVREVYGEPNAAAS